MLGNPCGQLDLFVPAHRMSVGRFQTIAYVRRMFHRYSATVQEMFNGGNAEAFPILEDIALVDEAFKSKPSGTKGKQEL